MIKGLDLLPAWWETPKSMDENTKYQRRIDYARKCVIILADQELRTSIPVLVGREVEFKVEYEWLPSVCNKYKILGHNTEACSKKTTKVQRPINQKGSLAEQISQEKENVGSSTSPVLKLVKNSNGSQDKDIGGREAEYQLVSSSEIGLPSSSSRPKLGKELILFNGDPITKEGEILGGSMPTEDEFMDALDGKVLAWDRNNSHLSSK